MALICISDRLFLLAASRFGFRYLLLQGVCTGAELPDTTRDRLRKLQGAVYPDDTAKMRP